VDRPRDLQSQQFNSAFIVSFWVVDKSIMALFVL
jgi:hypothetical protein